MPYVMGEPPVAGVTTKLGNETTENCMQLDERPTTPPEVRKWRKSNYAEPGKRVIHPGMIDDFAGRDFDHPKFGKIKVESDHVEDVWRQAGAESEYAQVKVSQKESIYYSTKREPLGKTYQRGHVLPAETKQADFAFGKECAHPENQSKQLIYTPSELPTEGQKAQYIKSHGSFEPGEQRRRGYDWKGLDVTQHRFGIGMGSHIALNGLAQGAVDAIRREDDLDPLTSKRVQNFKNLQDKLGQSRNLGHGLNGFGKDHVYGKKSVRSENEWDARTCLQGEYTEEEQEPDSDLGCTHTPGFRNITTQKQHERTFGTPTIRSDIPKYAKRSVADQQNYGDDANAQGLLYPSTLVSLGIDENEFGAARTKDEIIDIFTTIASDFSPDELASLYDVCLSESPAGRVSIDSFRKKTLEESLARFTPY